jgi:hypothetical protein
MQEMSWVKGDRSGVDNLTWAVAQIEPRIDDSLGSFYTNTVDGVVKGCKERFESNPTADKPMSDLGSLRENRAWI